MDEKNKIWMEYADPKTGRVQRRVEVRERKMSNRFIKTVYGMIGKYFNAAKKNSEVRGGNVLVYSTYRVLLCWWFKGWNSPPVTEIILRTGLLDNNTSNWSSRRIELNEKETTKKLIRYLEQYASLAVESVNMSIVDPVTGKQKKRSDNYFCAFRNIL